jgi:oxaloacetate decarboxylase alpha subunit
VTDPWNNFERLAALVHINDQSGMLSVVNVAYSISPRHTDDYYEQKAAEAAALNPWRICFKDVGGILTPERARLLFPRVIAASNGVPWEFHGHCCTGMASSCVVVAAECGIRHIHTGIPPLAEATAQPSIFTAVHNLNARGFDTRIDLEPLRRASAKLYTIARRHHYPIGVPVEIDYANYAHQVPGGMISHLAYQLRQVGQEARLPEVLVETAQVRQDFGYPIMITPLSQFVGSQAAFNVITGQRYESVSDEVILYAQGVYGEEAVAEMDPGVRSRILGRKRAEELANEGEASVTNPDHLKARFGDLSDAELSAVLAYGSAVLPLLRRGKEVPAYRFEISPEARWLRSLPKQATGRFVEIERGNVRLAVRLRGAEGTPCPV